MTYPDIYFDKDKTKFSHELCQILDEVTHGGPAPCCLWKSRPYVVGPVDSLSGAELGFGLVSEGDPDSFSAQAVPGKNHKLLKYLIMCYTTQYVLFSKP